MTPQISIITPSLNQGAYLPRALQSVAAQQGVAIEHLAFDPGSIDGSRRILSAWASEASNRSVFLERDAGPAEAINKGFARARSDIVCWLSSDDCYASDDALAQVQSAFATNPDCDIVYGRGGFINAASRLTRTGPFQLDTSKIDETLRAAAPFVQPAAFIRRSLIEKIGPLDPAFGLAYDLEFWLRAARAGAKFYALDADIARKRIHPESATQLLSGVHAMDCARATRAHGRTASSAWIARAVKAEVANGSNAAARVCVAVKRRLDRAAAAQDTLVVLGNGPSLAGFDFDQLRGVDAIGMNAAYRHWREIGWYPRYYACLDTVVGLSHRNEIEAMIAQADVLGVDAFLLRDNLIETFKSETRMSRRVINFDELSVEGGLMDVSPLTTGSHAALFGALLGYRTMVLLGVDCNYVERVEGAEARDGTVLELVETPAYNPNYFFEDYQRAGDRYNIPNPMPDLHISCWRAVGGRLAGRGAIVWNCSRTSRVDAFAYRPFSRLRASAV